MNKRYKLAVLIILAVMTGAAYAVGVKDVMVRQRWPWSRKVDIEYVLECTAGGEYDIEVKAYNGEVPLLLPPGSLSGDVYGVRDGARRIVWDPTLTAYADDGIINNFRVELIPVPAVLYMIVDLTKGIEEQGQIEYVYDDELKNGDWGEWTRTAVTNDGSVMESVIWLDVTNDVYKTDKLVLRRIKATDRHGYLAGSPPEEIDHSPDKEIQVRVFLSKPFYIGVFQVTQYQWEKIMINDWRASFQKEEYRNTRPMENISYDLIRGKQNDNPPVDWPETGLYVKPTSFLGMLRTATGLDSFDLPTEAQWEWACRAGTLGPWNVSGATLDELGRYRLNGGYINGTKAPDRATCTTDNGTAAVGTHQPNAWGIYDMHGNVYEWCLNKFTNEIAGGTDPVGETTGSLRSIRGGYFGSQSSECRSGWRWSSLSNAVFDRGFRLVINML